MTLYLQSIIISIRDKLNLGAWHIIYILQHRNKAAALWHAVQGTRSYGMNHNKRAPLYVLLEGPPREMPISLPHRWVFQGCIFPLEPLKLTDRPTQPRNNHYGHVIHTTLHNSDATIVAGMLVKWPKHCTPRWLERSRKPKRKVTFAARFLQLFCSDTSDTCSEVNS